MSVYGVTLTVKTKIVVNVRYTREEVYEEHEVSVR